MVTATTIVKEIPVQETKRTRSSSFTQTKPKVLRPFNTNEVKILLLENINETAIKAFKKQGYQVNKYIDFIIKETNVLNRLKHIQKL